MSFYNRIVIPLQNVALQLREGVDVLWKELRERSFRMPLRGRRPG